jgi:hypothetical protein
MCCWSEFGNAPGHIIGFHKAQIARTFAVLLVEVRRYAKLHREVAGARKLRRCL